MAAPTMPVEAQAADIDGAAAFVRYYWDAVNHAYQTGETDAMAAVVAPECAACQGLEKFIEDGFSDGGHIEGARIRVADVVVTPGDPEIGLGVAVVASQDGGQLFKEGAETTPLAGSPSALYDMEIVYDGRWTLMQWGTHDPPS